VKDRGHLVSDFDSPFRIEEGIGFVSDLVSESSQTVGDRNIECGGIVATHRPPILVDAFAPDEDLAQHSVSGNPVDDFTKGEWLGSARAEGDRLGRWIGLPASGSNRLDATGEYEDRRQGED